MPKATAVWLIENTTLTFDQVAEFCGMHPLEVQGIADGDVAVGIMGADPVAGGQIEAAEIEKAQEDETYKMQLVENTSNYIKKQQKVKANYTPIVRRQDKPDAIAWIIKNHPEVTDAQIGKLIGTTKSTISAIRDRSHWNISNIRSRDPVLLGICTQTDLDATVNKARDKAAKEKERASKEKEKAAKARKKASDAKKSQKKAAPKKAAKKAEKPATEEAKGNDIAEDADSKQAV
jgi:hypothetical protein